MNTINEEDKNVIKELDGMMKSSKELYEKILDTPGFAFHFNNICNLAKGKNEEVEMLRKDNENLKTVMIAAAEEIKEHWQAHCDEEGYGPANLMHRLEKGIPSQYGYTAGAFLNQEQTIKGQLEIINNLKKENDNLKSRHEAMSKYATGITNESHKTDVELAALKKQVIELEHEREESNDIIISLKKQVEEMSKWTKTSEKMPEGKVLLLTSSYDIIIGDWYRGEWRTHRSIWIDGVLKSEFHKGDIIAWRPLPDWNITDKQI